MSLPFRKSGRKKNSGYRVFIMGDPDSKQKWKSRLDKIKNPVSPNEEGAEKIIYCESASYSWKSIIAEIANTKKKVLFKFHGYGTHAAVGSYSSLEQGDVIEL
jgi:hypothetical protein